MSLSPICWHNVQCFDTHYTTGTDIVDRYNLKRMINYMNITNRLEFWETKAMINYKSSILLLYNLDLIRQCLRLGSFAMRSGPCLDNCWQLFVSSYFWGVKGTCSHSLDFCYSRGGGATSRFVPLQKFTVQKNAWARDKSGTKRDIFFLDILNRGKSRFQARWGTKTTMFFINRPYWWILATQIVDTYQLLIENLEGETNGKEPLSEWY